MANLVNELEVLHLKQKSLRRPCFEKRLTRELRWSAILCTRVSASRRQWCQNSDRRIATTSMIRTSFTEAPLAGPIRRNGVLTKWSGCPKCTARKAPGAADVTTAIPIAASRRNSPPVSSSKVTSPTCERRHHRWYPLPSFDSSSASPKKNIECKSSTNYQAISNNCSILYCIKL